MFGRAKNIDYLFNSQGLWIAFRQGRYVFDSESQWIGWTPWGDNDVVTPDGVYLATIVEENRLFKLNTFRDRGRPHHPATPFFPGIFPDPGVAGKIILPRFAEDVKLDVVPDLTDDFSLD